jgi:uncharacterized protein with NAD-binding domain and iron-sulfur cluster
VQVSQQKVAILGGGVGAMVTAFELTSQPNWQEHYDLTVYQIGWRLGGKGASGRNPKFGYRIEEHGLHLWFGMYENAFSVIRRCYEELGRSPDQPLATIEQAFRPYPFLGVMERLSSKLVPDPKRPPSEWHRRDDWATFIEEWQTNPGEPGTGDTTFHPWDLLRELMTVVLHAFSQMPFGRNQVAASPNGNQKRDTSATKTTFSTPLRDRAASDVAIAAAFLNGLRQKVATQASGATTPDEPFIRNARAAHRHLVYALERAAEGPHRAELVIQALDRIRAFVWDQVEYSVEDNVVLRRLWVLLDLGVSIILGVVKDGVLTKGYDAINEYDLIEWISRWGANKLTVNHGIVTGCYDFVFAYEDGKPENKNIAAGVVLRFMGQMLFGYRGSLAWTMSAGMGDTVFAPLYLVLRKRGVKFKFFHAVKKLYLDAGRSEIERIEVERQVTLTKNEEYLPFIDVNGLPCWPSEPRYDQIEQGEKLQQGWIEHNYNLESSWSAWGGGERLNLEKGKDFHVVVLGISLGALKGICAELSDPLTGGQRWLNLIDNVKTVETLSMQLWLRPELEALGWEGAPAVVDAYEWPLSTYADMSHLITSEKWEGQLERPGSIGYFCGVLEEHTSPPGDSEFPAEMLALVKNEARTWLDQYVTRFWPNAGTGDYFNYDLLVDPEGHKGKERLNAQYFRANVDLSERYVLSTRGSIKYRLRPGDSGYANLVLAGDWTWTPLNSGCVEGATMSGMLAARKVRELARDDTASAPIAGEAEIAPVRPVEEASRIELVGGYSGTMAFIELPESDVRAMIPADFTLASQQVTQKGTFPVLVACGWRENSRLTFPRTLLGHTYAEAMIAIPFVLPGPSRYRRGGPFLYVPKFFVTSKLMAVGGNALWGLDVDSVEVRHGSAGPGRVSWQVQTPLKRTPILCMSAGVAEPRRSLSRDAFERLDLILSQPIMCRSLHGCGPPSYACMEWNLAVAKAAAVDVAVTFGSGAALGTLRGRSHQVQATQASTLGAFHITAPSWRLSLPSRVTSADAVLRGPP